MLFHYTTRGSNGFMVYHYSPCGVMSPSITLFNNTFISRNFFKSEFASLLNKWWFIPIHYIVMSLRNRWLGSNGNTNSHLELYC